MLQARAVAAWSSRVYVATRVSSGIQKPCHACILVLPRPAFDGAQALFARLPVPARAVVVVGFGLLLRQVASFEVQPYIYIQF